VTIGYLILLHLARPYNHPADYLMHQVSLVEIYLVLLSGYLFSSFGSTNLSTFEDVGLSIILIFLSFLFIGLFIYFVVKGIAAVVVKWKVRRDLLRERAVDRDARKKKNDELDAAEEAAQLASGGNGNTDDDTNSNNNNKNLHNSNGDDHQAKNNSNSNSSSSSSSGSSGVAFSPVPASVASSNNNNNNNNNNNSNNNKQLKSTGTAEYSDSLSSDTEEDEQDQQQQQHAKKDSSNSVINIANSRKASLE
jgi:ABC-type transport system involved in multi-copper enzyme maturation permease subunit